MQPKRISGLEFIDRLYSGKGLPTSRYDRKLVVRDFVDLRGRCLRGSRIVYGVKFGNKVDLRELRVKGTLDLAYCVFDESLLLDDAEIEGTLRLDYITTSFLTMAGIVVRGQLGLNTAKLGRATAKIRDSVQFYDAVFEDGLIEGSLDMRGILANSLLMRGLRVQGDLRVGCGKEGAKQLSKIGTIFAPNIEVCGSVRVEGAGESGSASTGSVGPELILRNARIHGSVEIVPFIYFAGAKEYDTKTIDYESEYRVTDDIAKIVWSILKTVDLSGAQVGGNVVLGSAIYKSLSLRNARVSGNVGLEQGIVYVGKEENESPVAQKEAKIGVFDATGLNVEGYLLVRGVKIVGYKESKEVVDGDVNMTGASCRGIVAFENIEIDSNLDISGIRGSSHVSFLGVRVAKEIRLISGELGRLVFGLGKLLINQDRSQPRETRLAPAIIPCQAGRLIIQNTTIKGNLHLSHIKILGTVSNYGRRGLIVEDCRIAGDLTLWKIGAFRDLFDPGVKLDIDPWDFSAAVIGDLRIRRSRIDGSCILTFVKVSGEIDLQDSSVGGDLQVDSTLSHHSIDSGKRLREELRKIDNPMSLCYRAVCRQFMTRMLCCENDVDLSGLKIIASHQEVLRADGIGCLDAQYIEVKGDLIAYYKEKEHKGNKEAYTEIPGYLDLSYASIKHLIVSSHSFPAPVCLDPENARCDVEGLTLNHARIGTLEITETQDLRYPKPIELTNIKVDVWDVGKKCVGSYTCLLKNAPFNRSTYGAVEQYLRSQGQGEHADAIYRSMRNREWNESIKNKKNPEIWQVTLNVIQSVGSSLTSFVKDLPRSPLRTIPHHLHKIFLQYGTNPGRLLAIVIVLALASLPVYMNPTNFEASSSFLAEQPTAFINCDDEPPDKPGERCGPPKRGQSPSAWGKEDAVAMMIHNHVPVAPLLTRSDWEARSEDCVAYGGTFGCGRYGINPQHTNAPYFEFESIAAEDFANLMQLLNLIFWPLLLTFWVRRLLRQ